MIENSKIRKMFYKSCKLLLLIVCPIFLCGQTPSAYGQQDKEKQLVLHACQVCLKTSNKLFAMLSDRQMDAFFSPVFQRPGIIRIEEFPVFVGEPEGNPREWNAYARFTDQGSVCMVLTSEMVKSLYQLAKIQTSTYKEQSDARIDDLTDKVVFKKSLGSLSEGLGAMPQQEVDRICGYLSIGLVAHEFAHIYLGHLGTALRARGVTPNSSTQEMNAKLKKLVYKREQEMQCDIAALDHVMRVDRNAGVGMLYVFDFMYRIEQKYGNSDVPEVVLSHPHAKTRINYLLRRLITVHKMDITRVFPHWFLLKYGYR